MAGWKTGVAFGSLAAGSLLLLPSCSMLAEAVSSFAGTGSGDPAATAAASSKMTEAARNFDAELWNWILAYLGLRTAGADVIQGAAKVARSRKRRERKPPPRPRLVQEDGKP